eukprot:TRINITY_DN75558_c0_g1_i1.p1 TRINITY_DN75558_c0_g1~~TRINITY_DN75558_c0_g1_i1.p1  ORF type:complete len:174 (-),score=15.55 TRINITY_DN75558_c0_g1_i1:47-568(-)
MKTAFLLVVVFLSVGLHCGKTPIRSVYSVPGGGCVCDGIETFNGLNRPFVVSCNRKDDTPEFRRRREFNGEPHNCQEYNKHQQKFYDQLLGKIGHRMCVIHNPGKRPEAPKRIDAAYQRKLAHWTRTANGISCNPIAMDGFVHFTQLCGDGPPKSKKNTPQPHEAPYILSKCF